MRNSKTATVLKCTFHNHKWKVWEFWGFKGINLEICTVFSKMRMRINFLKYSHNSCWEDNDNFFHGEVWEFTRTVEKTETKNYSWILTLYLILYLNQ
jgi:hypothetical protein